MVLSANIYVTVNNAGGENNIGATKKCEMIFRDIASELLIFFLHLILVSILCFFSWLLVYIYHSFPDCFATCLFLRARKSDNCCFTKRFDEQYRKEAMMKCTKPIQKLRKEIISKNLCRRKGAIAKSTISLLQY